MFKVHSLSNRNQINFRHMLKQMTQTVTSSNDGLRYILILLPHP